MNTEKIYFLKLCLDGLENVRQNFLKKKKIKLDRILIKKKIQTHF
jgi:hypothetical protein